MEKWLRIVTSVGALYMESAMHGAVVPLLSNWEWTYTNNASGDAQPFNSGERDPGAHASFTISVIFLTTGIVGMCLSPVAGILADRFGLDAVVLFGLLMAVAKSLLYGLGKTTLHIVLANRILHGATNAFIQTMTIARIRDVYDQPESTESTNVMAVAFCELSFSLFAGVLTGMLFDAMKERVFLLFLPITVLLSMGILVTFRLGNSHSGIKFERSNTHAGNSSSSQTLQWRVFLDFQVAVVSLIFFVVTLAQTSLEPALAVWTKSAFGVGSSPTAIILGFCGLATIISSITTAVVLPLFRDRPWILCCATLWITGIPLILLKFSSSVGAAGLALCVYFFGANATRFVLLSVCSRIANARYLAAYGMVFAMANIGWSASFLVGPLLAPLLFGSLPAMTFIGVACIVCSLLVLVLRNTDTSTMCGACFKDHEQGRGYERVTTNVQTEFTYDMNKIAPQDSAH